MGDRPNKLPRPKSEHEGLKAAWELPKGWRIISAVNNTVVGYFYVAADVRIEAASICGTDLHIRRWDEWSAERVKPPLTLGHELCGTVTAVGRNVSESPRATTCRRRAT